MTDGTDEGKASRSMRERLLGGDLRSIAQADEVAASIRTQGQFDLLFSFLHEGERLLTMRSIDAIEKVTRRSPRFLAPHKDEILAFGRRATDPENTWHLALLLSRLALTGRELDEAIGLLTRWALDKSGSRIVRVNAIQALHDLSGRDPMYEGDFLAVIDEVGREQVPSLNARIRKLRVGREDTHDET